MKSTTRKKREPHIPSVDKVISWPSPKQTNSPTGSDSSQDRYEPCGYCGFCLMTIEARPGGYGVRHKQTLVPYGHCPQAIEARRVK